MVKSLRFNNNKTVRITLIIMNMSEIVTSMTMWKKMKISQMRLT